MIEGGNRRAGEHSDADRRSRTVRLTDDGRTLIERAWATHERDMDEVFAELTTDQLRALLSTLHTLRAADKGA